MLANGAYGDRLARIAAVLGIDHVVHDSGELAPPDLDRLDAALRADAGITHVVCVHCETTTGMLNPLAEICGIVKRHSRRMLVDSMSGFGGIPLDVADLGIDALVSSANKCIQGVPGFGFVIVRRDVIAAAGGQARSLSLDLCDQWTEMEKGRGKWRYTSPTHVVRAFFRALQELDAEGGVAARHARYGENQRRLVAGMERSGFECVLPRPLHSPIITGFRSPPSPRYDFRRFYDWGGGLVWIATEAAGDAGSAAIRAALAGTGGHATLIRAPAEIRAAADVFEPLPPALRTVTEGIKTSLDPDRLFNPGRMYAGI